METEFSSWRNRFLVQFSDHCDELLSGWHLVIHFVKLAEVEMPVWVFGVGSMCERFRDVVRDDRVHGFVAFIFAFRHLLTKLSTQDLRKS